jgi:hypothetical protein
MDLYLGMYWECETAVNSLAAGSIVFEPISQVHDVIASN